MKINPYETPTCPECGEKMNREGRKYGRTYYCYCGKKIEVSTLTSHGIGSAPKIIKGLTKRQIKKWKRVDGVESHDS